MKEIPALVERYLSLIQSFIFSLIHRAGTLIPGPDALSRIQLLEGRHSYKCSNKLLLDKVSNPTLMGAIVSKVSSKEMVEAMEQDRDASKAIIYLETKKFPESSSKEEQSRIMVLCANMVYERGLLLLKADPDKGFTNP